MTKATILGPSNDVDAEGGGGSVDDRIQCDFCGATYNLRTGQSVKEEGGGKDTDDFFLIIIFDLE